MLVIIGSSPDRTAWAADAASSLNREHIVVSNYGYELGKIRWVVENTHVERFLFLQDSWVIKSDKFWELLHQTDGSVSLLRDPYFYGCYAGVYESRVIEKIGLPIVESKRDSVRLEVDWHQKYVLVAGEPQVLFPELTDSSATRTEMRHGRENLVLENEFVVKYKGTWRHEQIVD